MNNGVLPVKKDHRAYSATRTLGALGALAPDLSLLPESYNCDAQFRFPDQNAEGLPQGCTGYAQSELCQNEDGIPYQARYTYDKTLFLEGKKEGVPCNIENSLKTTLLWGVLPNSTSLNNAAINFYDSTDEEAAKHKRGGYFTIELNYGLDWYDSMKNMIWASRSWKGSVSLAAPWFPEWSGVKVNSTGIVSAPVGWMWFSGHNPVITGWTTTDTKGKLLRNGESFLIVKSWQGKLFGDNGYMYYSREIFNRLMAVGGSAAFLLIPADMYNPADVRLVKLTWRDWVTSYLRFLTSRL